MDVEVGEVSAHLTPRPNTSRMTYGRLAPSKQSPSEVSTWTRVAADVVLVQYRVVPGAQLAATYTCQLLLGRHLLSKEGGLNTLD